MESLYDYHNTTGCKLQQIVHDSRADESQKTKQKTVPEKKKVMTMQNARHSILLTLNQKDNSNSDHLGVLIFDRTQEVREEDSEQFQNNQKDDAKSLDT